MSKHSKPVAIVTAASKGMGEAIARQLANVGYDLVLLARGERVLDIASELGAIAVRGSVTEIDDLVHAVSMANDRFGRIDAVINNTGHPPTGDLLGIRDEDWQFGLDMILLNVIRMCRLVTPFMIAQGHGSFLNISSIGAQEPDLNYPVSSILRSGLAGFAKLFCNKYAGSGLRMNNLLPGCIDSYPQEPEVLAEIPAGRLGRATEIGSIVAFLVSQDASYINGQSIVVDGGLLRRA